MAVTPVTPTTRATAVAPDVESTPSCWRRGERGSRPAGLGRHRRRAVARGRGGRAHRLPLSPGGTTGAGQGARPGEKRGGGGAPVGRRTLRRPRPRGVRRSLDGRADVLDGRGRGSPRRRPRAGQLSAAPAGQARAPARGAFRGHHRALSVRIGHPRRLRDPGRAEEATQAITGPVTHVWTEGGDHSLRGRDAQVAGVVAEWLLAL